MNDPSAPSITHVRERDVDLMFLQLIQTSPEFRDWFVHQLDSNLREKRLLGSRKSARNDSAEVDIAFAIETPDGTVHYVLVENKIDEKLQERQPERYYEEGEYYQTAGECDVFHVCLIAPKSYISDEKRRRFGNVVTYEDIRLTVNGLEHDGSPTISELLQVAIEKDTSGLEPVISEVRQRMEGKAEMLPSLESPGVTDKHLTFKSGDPAHPENVAYKLHAVGDSDGNEVDVRIDVTEKDSTKVEEIRSVLREHKDEIEHLDYSNSRGKTIVLKKLRKYPAESSEEFHDRVTDELCALIVLYHPYLSRSN